MRPPFTLTQKLVNLIAEISLLLGKYEGLHAPVPQPKLRRQNRIKTIKDSLAIEGNTLDLETVTALFEGKRVAGPSKDVLEVQNAAELYGQIAKFRPSSMKDLLWAHRILMKGLVSDAGTFRAGAVGILKGSMVSHIAPPAKHVSKLMDDLFLFLKKEREISPLLMACIFHYELEFIHPFSDGNGRLGRFWQSLILSRFNSAFEYLPVESLVRQRQTTYYKVLEASDRRGDSTPFLEFSLGTIRDALAELLADMRPEPETSRSRLDVARRNFQDRIFTRKDYLRIFKTISTATASRDLAFGVKSGLLKISGTKATAKYRFKNEHAI